VDIERGPNPNPKFLTHCGQVNAAPTGASTAWAEWISISD